MKSPEVIDRLEKTLPEVLSKCRYCGEPPEVYTKSGRNHAGREGFFSTVKCTGCGVSVFAFGPDARSADVMARCYWEKGVLDAE